MGMEDELLRLAGASFCRSTILNETITPKSESLPQPHTHPWTYDIRKHDTTHEQHTHWNFAGVQSTHEHEYTALELLSVQNSNDNAVTRIHAGALNATRITDFVRFFGLQKRKKSF